MFYPIVPNLEFIKCMHVIDLDFDPNSQQTLKCIGQEAEIQDISLLDGSDQLLPPPLCSRVGGEGSCHVAFDMKVTLVAATIMTMYLSAKEKLKRNLN